ncbi:hypothetical protein HAX54_002789 [Datura stramonium]|uniref:Uncharacterized protein n=1 Tax=Datura stramonium TaxID=4076 RepID=A0ABS8T6L2_DATST|nr:hypothetical protein [Datura stramonium]
MEEEIFKETFASLFLNNGRLEEVCQVEWMQGEEEQGMIGDVLTDRWCKGVRRQSTAGCFCQEPAFHRCFAIQERQFASAVPVINVYAQLIAP